MHTALGSRGEIQMAHISLQHIKKTYDNGVTVTVNYNNSEAEVNGEKIPAMGYTVNGGEGL